MRPVGALFGKRSWLPAIFERCLIYFKGCFKDFKVTTVSFFVFHWPPLRLVSLQPGALSGTGLACCAVETAAGFPVARPRNS